MENQNRVSVATRLRQIMSERHLKQADILRMVAPYCKMYGERIGSNALSEWVNGKYEPNQRKLTILGMALNVSEAWLMGYDGVQKERTVQASTPTSTITVTISESDLRLLEAYHANPSAQVFINRMLGLPDPEDGDNE